MDSCGCKFLYNKKNLINFLKKYDKGNTYYWDSIYFLKIKTLDV